MRLALVAAILPALALAAPTPENDKHVDKYDDKKHGDEGTRWRDEYQDSHRGEWKEDDKKYDDHKKDEHKGDDKKYDDHKKDDHRGDDKKYDDHKKDDHRGDDKKYDDHKKDDHRGDDKKDEHKGDDKKDDCPKDAWKGSFPFHFTSTAVAYADGNQIVNNSQVAVPGLEGGWGQFSFGLNSVEDVICHNITVWIRGDYQSPAVTATHIHEAAKGAAGPPRIAFPNPVPLPGQPEDLNEWSWRQSLGCVRGPFVTGVVNNGTDAGEGFTIAELEANPVGFFADTHTAEFPAGAIRGQLQWY